MAVFGHFIEASMKGNRRLRKIFRHNRLVAAAVGTLAALPGWKAR
jgi:hypothetical protein